MPMKRFSGSRKLSRAKARNAALINQLATPGLGSLVARRWLAGTGQLLLAGAGFVLIMLWFGEEMLAYYGEAFSATPVKKTVPLTLLFAGVGLFALAWVWSLFTSFSLLHEASRVSLESLESFAAGQIKMEEAKIILALGALRDWLRAGPVISRTYQFQDFPAALRFVNTVGDLAEQAQHHPDIDIRWNKVTLALTTHDAGGLTEKDFALARQCDALAQER